MSIEVRQMVVKSNVLQRCEQDGANGREAVRIHEDSKNELLEECRKLILEMLRERRER